MVDDPLRPRTDGEKETQRITVYETDPHPEYGPCDGFGNAGDRSWCSMCGDLRYAAVREAAELRRQLELRLSELYAFARESRP